MNAHLIYIIDILGNEYIHEDVTVDETEYQIVIYLVRNKMEEINFYKSNLIMVRYEHKKEQK